MKHGILSGDVIMPDARFHFGANKVILNGRTYQFIGYKSSILKYLIDHGDCTFEAGAIASDEYGTKVNMNLCIRGGEVGQSAAQVMTDTVQSAALGFASGIAPALEVMGQAMDAVSAVGVANDATSATDRLSDAKTSRPGKFKSFIDHRFGKRIIIDICSFMSDSRGKVVKTNATEITFSAVAAAVAGLP